MCKFCLYLSLRADFWWDCCLVQDGKQVFQCTQPPKFVTRKVICSAWRNEAFTVCCRTTAKPSLTIPGTVSFVTLKKALWQNMEAFISFDFNKHVRCEYIVLFGIKGQDALPLHIFGIHSLDFRLTTPLRILLLKRNLFFLTSIIHSTWDVIH